MVLLIDLNDGAVIALVFGAGQSGKKEQKEGGKYRTQMRHNDHSF
jgi:hypothetical protein